jgi:hypothetical protein
VKIKNIKDIINLYYHYFQTEEFDGNENIEEMMIIKNTDKLNTDKLDTNKSNTNKSDGIELHKHASKINENVSGKRKVLEVNTIPLVLSKPLDIGTKSIEVGTKSTNPNSNPNPSSNSTNPNPSTKSANPTQVKSISADEKSNSKLAKRTTIKEVLPAERDIPTHRLLPPQTQVFNFLCFIIYFWSSI